MMIPSLLSAGLSMAAADIPVPTPENAAWMLYCEMFQSLRWIPDPDRRILTAGLRVHWPEVVLSDWENRISQANNPPPTDTRLKPTPGAFDRMNAMIWVVAKLPARTNRRRDMGFTMRLAYGVRAAQVARDCGLDRSTIKRIRERVSEELSEGLKKTLQQTQQIRL